MLNFLYNFWFIQALGAVALIFVILAWNAQTRKKILELQSINLALFIAHYLLLNALAGAIMCAIVLARNLVFIEKNDAKWASHPAWLYIFVALSVSGVLLSWKGLITILPAVGVVLGTYAISRNNPAEIRFFMLIACVIWIPYTIVVHSYAGLFSQIVGIIGILMGMYRHDRRGVVSPNVE